MQPLKAASSQIENFFDALDASTKRPSARTLGTSKSK
jgi:hypothetical protein